MPNIKDISKNQSELLSVLGTEKQEFQEEKLMSLNISMTSMFNLNTKQETLGFLVILN